MKIDVLEKIDSTNLEMKRRAQKHKLDSELALMTREQTHGRGRGERTWKCRPGESLAVSYWVDFNEKSGLNLQSASVLPLIVGLAAIKAAEKRLAKCGKDTQESLNLIGLKWPNDVIVKEKGKLAGILCELVHSQFNFGVVVGLGFNLKDSEGVLRNLPRPAAVWSEIFQDNWSAEEACADIGCELFNLVKRLSIEGFASIAKEWYAHCLHKGLNTAVKIGLAPKDSDFMEGNVRFGQGAATVPESQSIKVGQTIGLGEHGELLLRSNEGEILSVTIGDVSF